jgi:hypothetical protein
VSLFFGRRSYVSEHVTWVRRWGYEDDVGESCWREEEESECRNGVYVVQQRRRGSIFAFLHRQHHEDTDM